MVVYLFLYRVHVVIVLSQMIKKSDWQDTKEQLNECVVVHYNPWYNIICIDIFLYFIYVMIFTIQQNKGKNQIELLAKSLQLIMRNSATYRVLTNLLAD